MTDTTDQNTSSNNSQTNSVPPVITTASAATDEGVTVENAAVSSTPVALAAAVVPTADTADTSAPMSDTAIVATTAAAWWKKPVVIQYGIAFLIVAIMGVGLLYILEKQGRTNTKIFSTLQSFLIKEPIVATVNGEEITQAQFEKNRAQLSEQASGQGADPTVDPVKTEIETQALDILINTALLRQAAAAAGIVVTPDQVNARYDEIVTSQGGAEQLAARMTELGITEESLRADIEGEILIQTHLTATLDPSTIDITDEEIKTFYDSVASGAPTPSDVPPLAEVREQIIQQLRVGKEQELVTAYIEKLRANATIEKKTE
jgi:FKBP-type peptidyl-prolyl cis-trans isomerase (trigger factor)